MQRKKIPGVLLLGKDPDISLDTLKEINERPWTALFMYINDEVTKSTSKTK